MPSNHQLKTFEISAALATGAGKLLFMNALEWKLPFILAVSFFWIGYVVLRYSKNKDILNDWGLHTKGFRATFLELFPIFLLCVIGFILVGNYMETSVLSWSIVLTLVTYPLWGIVQQFLVLSLFGKNVREIGGEKLSVAVIIFLTAVLFGAIHYPVWLLIGGTFLLAVVYTTLYFRGRNLLVLGIYHGWLAAFFGSSKILVIESVESIFHFLVEEETN